MVAKLHRTFDAINLAAANTHSLQLLPDGTLSAKKRGMFSWQRKYNDQEITSIVRTLHDSYLELDQLLHDRKALSSNTPLYNCLLAALRVQQVIRVAMSDRATTPFVAQLIKKGGVEHPLLLPKDLTPCLIGKATLNAPLETVVKATGPVKRGRRYVYPGKSYSQFSNVYDNSASFVRTQGERLLSLLGRIIERIGKKLHRNISCFNRFHYFRNHEKERDVYDTKSLPMSLTHSNFESFFVGHATCFFSIPVPNGSKINVLTDPIDGKNRLFYPRMTRPGRTVDQLPPVHVVCLSHNHSDHFSPSTLKKLIGMNPLAIVPKGDGEFFRKIGFTRVVEMSWFQHAEVTVDNEKNERSTLEVFAVPARHISGNNSIRSFYSLFNGYVFRTKAMDDVYFSGDTARLNSEHTDALAENFRITRSFQQGGPDDKRSEEVGTHQCSVDALAMHMHLMIKHEYDSLIEKTKMVSFQEFKKLCAHFVTTFMHLNTFKLGDAHFDGSKASVTRLVQWLQQHDSWDSMWKDHGLRSYEEEVLRELGETAKEIHFVDSPHLTPKQLAELLEVGKNLLLPKIGETT